MIGDRMRTAAHQAGYVTTTAMAEAGKWSQPTVSRWWRGEQVPDPDDMALYAELTGKRVWWFYLDASDREFDLVADTLRQILGETVTNNRDLAEAFSQVTGRHSEFSRREAELMKAGTPAVREKVKGEAGDAWERLPRHQQEAIVDRLAGEALPDREL